MPSWSICTNSRLSAPAAMTNTHVFGYHCPRRPCACVHFCEMLLTEHLRMPYGWLTEVSAGRNREKKTTVLRCHTLALSILICQMSSCSTSASAACSFPLPCVQLNISMNTPNLDVGFLSQLAFQAQLTEPYGKLTEPYGIHAISSFGSLYKKKDHVNIFRNTSNLNVVFVTQLDFQK